MRVLRFGLLLMGVMILIATGLVGMGRREPAKSHLILYQVEVDGLWTPYVMVSDGSHQQPLATYLRRELPALDYFNPRWSPDHRWIVFSTGDRIARLRLRNAYLEYLRDDVGSMYYSVPSWSPDGTSIVYTESISGRNNIVRIEADGTQRTLLTGDEFDNRYAVWSPDGAWFTYISAWQQDRGMKITRMRVDGSDVEQLTLPDVEDTHHLPYNTVPAWSPDSEWIVFSTYYDLFRISLDGSRGNYITRSGLQDFSPAWSPDGQWIVFARRRRSHFEIFRVRPDGSDPEQLTDGPNDKANPQYSPIIDLPLAGSWLVLVGFVVMVGPMGGSVMRRGILMKFQKG